MSHIQWQTRGRGFDVGSRSGFVGGFKARADKYGIDIAAVVRGVDGEDVEDWICGQTGGKIRVGMLCIKDTRRINKLIGCIE